MHEWPSERQTFADPISGAMLERLTCWRGHSHHLYFTVDGRHAGGRRLLIGSDRGRGFNLCSVDLEGGGIRLVSDLVDVGPAGLLNNHLGSCCHPYREEAYLWSDRDLLAVELEGGRMRSLGRLPANWTSGCTSVTADGHWVLTIAVENPLPPGAPYLDWFHGRRPNRVLAIATDGSGLRVLHETDRWLGHANASPTDPGLATFCEEGPWHLVDCRIRGLDLASGRTWPIRPRDDVWAVGHEYWLPDGRRIGYHARHAEDDRRHILGFVSPDGRQRRETEIAWPTQHAHSRTEDLVVLDGTRSAGDRLMLAVRRADGGFDLRYLCQHGTSRHQHLAHAHPHLDPDGWVVFTSDRVGYADVYRVRIPEDPSRLPLADAPPWRFYWA